jgi:succinyl-diaminopimelate desuccinylase
MDKKANITKAIDPRANDGSIESFHFSAEMDQEVVDICCRLVSIKSFNPPGNELEIATFTHNYLTAAGLDSELIYHDAQRASVIARLPGNGAKKALLFSAHLDTVPVGAEQWLHLPYQAEISQGKIWGRGTADMKGGLAAILVAARAIAASGANLSGNLVLALSAGEEVTMLGAHALAQRPELKNLQGMMVAEPTANDLIIAEKGILWLEITTTGKTAHGSMPEYGRNAVRMMITLISELDRLEFPFQPHPLLGNFSRSLNTIRGGIQTNIVPDHCEITIDMRTVPGQDHAQIILQVQNVIDRLKSQDSDFSATLRITQIGTALATPPDDPMVITLGEIITHVTGTAPAPKGVRYFTDAAIYAPVSPAPIIICGPGPTELAHQPDEYVEVEKLQQAARIYTLAAYQLLK